METTENNKLIAEFMKYKKHHQDESVFIFQTENGNDTISIEQLLFNSNWNLLMEVVLECKRQQIFGSQNLIDAIDSALIRVEKAQVYTAVLDFIEFYKNPQKKSSKKAIDFETVCLKAIMKRYGSLSTLRQAMYEDTDVVLVNLADDLNDQFDENEILIYIQKIMN